jgi:2,4-dienoyl-CoA reductase-like NADH-dependent reductase (Old Yellow Enzyme family)
LHNTAATPIEIGTLHLKNRIAMAPMTHGQADENGSPTETMVTRYRLRAEGGTGLIITEGTLVDYPSSGDNPHLPGIQTPQQLKGWEAVVQAVHAAGAKIIVQLWHMGPFAQVSQGPETIARGDGQTIQAMSEEQKATAIAAFARAAKNAIEIGFDGVELHGAHGYLLDAFLSHRRYAQAPPMHERMVFPLQIATAVREAMGNQFVAYRMSPWAVDDYDEHKFRDPEMLAVFVGGLAKTKVDLIHVSTRMATAPAFPEIDPKRTLAGWVRSLSGLPVAAVGSIGVTVQGKVQDPNPALQLLDNQEADLLVIGRGILANPDWADKVLSGKWQELKPHS